MMTETEKAGIVDKLSALWEQLEREFSGLPVCREVEMRVTKRAQELTAGWPGFCVNRVALHSENYPKMTFHIEWTPGLTDVRAGDAQ